MSRDATEIADLVLRLMRTAYGGCAADGMTQAQWIALRYFARANRFSRNVSGFAAFHATTRGTASQTISSLVDRGYLARTRSDRDGRSVHFDLTARARRALADDPLEGLCRAVDTLPAALRTDTARGLRAALAELEAGAETADERIGVCRLCGHRAIGSDGGARCELLRESLAHGEEQELCMRFLARD